MDFCSKNLLGKFYGISQRIRWCLVHFTGLDAIRGGIGHRGYGFSIKPPVTVLLCSGSEVLRSVLESLAHLLQMQSSHLGDQSEFIWIFATELLQTLDLNSVLINSRRRMVETAVFGKFHFNHRADLKRWIPAFLSSHRTLFTILWVVAFVSVFVWQRNIVEGLLTFRKAPARPLPSLRPVVYNLTDFGGVGDGVTVNTEAFERAMLAISKLGKKGGGQLNVPAGNWLTAPFNLTSHLTLFLDQDAVILGLQVSFSWWDTLYITLLPVTKIVIVLFSSLLLFVAFSFRIFSKYCIRICSKRLNALAGDYFLWRLIYLFFCLWSALWKLNIWDASGGCEI